jgi:hypothetical protein
MADKPALNITVNDVKMNSINKYSQCVEEEGKIGVERSVSEFSCPLNNMSISYSTKG